MELHSFDEAYVRRLKDGDAAAQHEFASYFSDLLLFKLRARFLPSSAVNEIRQETFVRVLSVLKGEEGIRHPECLGAFVNSVCDNILQEHYRRTARFDSLDDHADLVDQTIDLDGALISRESGRAVRAALTELPAKDQKLLRAIFLDERSKDELCRELGVDRNYLRVLLHRAKAIFRLHFPKKMVARVAN